MFSEMMAGIEAEALEMVFRLQAAKPERFKGIFSSISQEFLHPEAARPQMSQEDIIAEEAAFVPPKAAPAPRSVSHQKVGRNDPCPCHSGKKYKKCCGR